MAAPASGSTVAPSAVYPAFPVNILVAKNGSQLGPFSENELRAKLTSGEFSPADYGWHEGLTSWSPLSQLLGSAPAAPLPPESQGHGSTPALYSPPPQSRGPAKSFINLNHMTPNKQQYLDAVRANTAYPTYRGIIGVITILGYVLAGLSVLGALISGVMSMRESFFGGLVVLISGLVGSALIFLGARFWKEAALILADIGDSITEANSRS